MRLKAGDFEGLTFRIRKNVATAAEQIRTRGEYFSSLLSKPSYPSRKYKFMALMMQTSLAMAVLTELHQNLELKLQVERPLAIGVPGREVNDILQGMRKIYT